MELTPRNELDDDAFIEDDELKITEHCTVDRTRGSEIDKEIRDKPDAVTESLAKVAWNEIGVDVTDHGIKVVPNEPGELDEEGDSDRED